MITDGTSFITHNVPGEKKDLGDENSILFSCLILWNKKVVFIIPFIFIKLTRVIHWEIWITLHFVSLLSWEELCQKEQTAIWKHSCYCQIYKKCSEENTTFIREIIIWTKDNCRACVILVNWGYVPCVDTWVFIRVLHRTKEIIWLYATLTVHQSLSVGAWLIFTALNSGMDLYVFSTVYGIENINCVIIK